MVTMDTDVEELLGLVSNCGRDIDDAVSQLENLSEVVKKGMQQAQDELRKEADNQIWQEGILRGQQCKYFYHLIQIFYQQTFSDMFL